MNHLGLTVRDSYDVKLDDPKSAVRFLKIENKR